MIDDSTLRTNPVRNVSDTALWVAMFRALESERADALFNDPHARRLAGARGQAIMQAMPSGAGAAWPMVVRTAVMDEIVLRCAAQGTATVLNLAAGLDTRPWRLDLPPSLTWLHVDMPEMLDYFQQGMADHQPRCQVQYLAADLRDREQRHDVLQQAAGRGPVLAITEGLLIYLESADVAELATDLRQIARADHWLTDLALPKLRAYLERTHAPRLRAGNAPMQFFPAEGTRFFEPFGWRKVEFRSTWLESRRLNRRMRGAWLADAVMRLQPRARREASQGMSGIALLQAAP